MCFVCCDSTISFHQSQVIHLPIFFWVTSGAIHVAMKNKAKSIGSVYKQTTEWREPFYRYKEFICITTIIAVVPM